MRRGLVYWRYLLAVPLHRESMNVYREIFLYWTRVVSRTKAPETEDRVIYCNKKLNTVVYGLVEWVNVVLCECGICIYNFSIYFFLFIHWRERNAKTSMLLVIFLLYFALLLVIFLLFCIDYCIVLLYLYWFKKHYLYWFWFLLWINFFE